VKILVADDHPLIRDAFRHLLATLSPESDILEAGDCETTLQRVAENPDLDLVLLDLRLPGQGGLATLEILRRENPALPIVVVSAVEDANVVRNVLARGAMGFIPKSSSNDVMQNALRLVFSGGRYMPPEILASDAKASSGPTSADQIHLTGRQRDVLALIIQGKSNKQICRDLDLAEATVKIHVTAILRALKVNSRAQVIVAANRLGISSHDRADGIGHD